MRKVHIYDPIKNNEGFVACNEKHVTIPIYSLYLRSSTTNFLCKMTVIIGVDPITMLVFKYSKTKFKNNE